jgi:hypothetical protein
MFSVLGFGGFLKASMSMSQTSCGVENMVHALHQMEVVKFGNFKLKNGIWLSIYIDFRMIIHTQVCSKKL